MTERARPVFLGPGVRAEVYKYRNGRTESIFTAPYPVEGPTRIADRNGCEAWVFGYAHFVFCWVDGSVLVQVSHGTLRGPKMPLWDDIKITGKWSGPALACFGEAWAVDHLGRFGW
jgi:hypothetical protein